METQEKQILEYLQNGNTLTKLESLKMFGCWNTGDVIYKLRKKGFNIKTEMIQDNGKEYAQYSLMPKDELSVVISPELRKFLLAEGVFDMFLKNCKAKGKIKNIGQGFVWENSPQGQKFWSELENKFQEWLESQNNESN